MNEVRLIIKIPYLFKEYYVSFSSDLTLIENIKLLNQMINEKIFTKDIIIVESNTGIILNTNYNLKKLKVTEGMTLILY